MWAPAPARLAVSAAGRTSCRSSARASTGSARFAGDDYLLVVGGEALARPVLALPARGRARAVARRRRRRLRLDATSAGPGSRSTSSSSTSSTSAPSPARAPSTRRSRACAGLRELGVTAIELMPVADVPRRARLGLRRPLHVRPHPAYGGPHGLARLVDAAHAEGLGVILDVVYNHVGPGNEALRALRPVLHRPARDLLGRRDRLLAARRARVGDPERRAVGARLPRRRAAPRRGARDLRRLASRTSAPSSPRACATRARRALVISEMEVGRLAADRGVGPRRAVGRPLAPRAARPPHRRARGLLRGLRLGRLARRGPARPRPRPAAARRLRPEPRPGRQPRARRPPAAGRAARRRRRHALLAVHAAALHGRGVPRGRAVPVLHRPHRPGDRRGDARGAAAGVRGVRRLLRRGGARPAGARDLPPLEARPARARPALPRAARAAPRAAARARGRGGRGGEVLRLRRGGVALVADFGNRTVELRR